MAHFMLWNNVFSKDKTDLYISNVPMTLIDCNYTTTNLVLGNFLVMNLEKLVETKSQSSSSKQEQQQQQQRNIEPKTNHSRSGEP